MDKLIAAEELYKRYDIVKRGRGPFLYTQRNVRLTDMYQEDGRAILGWGGGSAFTMMKNAIEPGATGSYITRFRGRLAKAVNALLKTFDAADGGRAVFAFNRADDAAAAAHDMCGDDMIVWKPWAGLDSLASGKRCFMFAPTFPWADEITLLAVRGLPAPEPAEGAPSGPPASAAPALPPRAVRLAPPIEAGVTRSIYNLIAAFKERGEAGWRLYDKYIAPYWERRGPYLTCRVAREDYDAFFLHCLDLGIVINPDPAGESIVPFGADAGVLRILSRRPFRREAAQGEPPRADAEGARSDPVD